MSQNSLRHPYVKFTTKSLRQINLMNDNVLKMLYQRKPIIMNLGIENETIEFKRSIRNFVDFANFVDFCHF